MHGRARIIVFNRTASSSTTETERLVCGAGLAATDWLATAYLKHSERYPDRTDDVILPFFVVYQFFKTALFVCVKREPLLNRRQRQKHHSYGTDTHTHTHTITPPPPQTHPHPHTHPHTHTLTHTTYYKATSHIVLLELFTFCNTKLIHFLA